MLKYKKAAAGREENKKRKAPEKAGIKNGKTWE